MSNDNDRCFYVRHWADFVGPCGELRMNHPFKVQSQPRHPFTEAPASVGSDTGTLHELFINFCSQIKNSKGEWHIEWTHTELKDAIQKELEKAAQIVDVEYAEETTKRLALHIIGINSNGMCIRHDHMFHDGKFQPAESGGE